MKQLKKILDKGKKRQYSERIKAIQKITSDQMKMDINQKIISNYVLSKLNNN